MRQIKKMMQRGLLDPEKEDPFSLFVASTNIRYCFYHDTHKILGNTFGMCVLQVTFHITCQIGCTVWPPQHHMTCLAALLYLPKICNFHGVLKPNQSGRVVSCQIQDDSCWLSAAGKQPLP